MKNYIQENYKQAQFLPNMYDEAIIGLSIIDQKPVYSIKKCVDIHIREKGFSFELMYIDFLIDVNNMFKSDVSKTPIICLDIELPKD